MVSLRKALTSQGHASFWRGLQDGEVVVWHDERILPEKCSDTAPVVSSIVAWSMMVNWPAQVPDDPTYPYVGKFISNLTLAQIKTLDCGSKRQTNYRMYSPFNCGLCRNHFTQPISLYILEHGYPHYGKSSISCPAQIRRTRSFGILSQKLTLNTQIGLLAWMILSRSNMRYSYLAHTTNLLL
jgi:hypothetical protein